MSIYDCIHTEIYSLKSYDVNFLFTWIFEPQALSSTNYFSMSILRDSVTVGEVILFIDASFASDQEKEKKIGERNEPRGSLRREKGGAALCPSPGHPTAHFLRRYFSTRLASFFLYFSYLTPFFAFFPHCGAWSQVNDSYAMKLEKLPLKTKSQLHASNTSSSITNNRNEHWKTIRSKNLFQTSSSLSFPAFFRICCIIHTFS